jgi:hypothetical protein
MEPWRQVREWRCDCQFSHTETNPYLRNTALPRNFERWFSFSLTLAVWPAWVLGRVLPVNKGVNGAATTNVTP